MMKMVMVYDIDLECRSTTSRHWWFSPRREVVLFARRPSLDDFAPRPSQCTYLVIQSHTCHDLPPLSRPRPDIEIDHIIVRLL